MDGWLYRGHYDVALWIVADDVYSDLYNRLYCVPYAAICIDREWRNCLKEGMCRFEIQCGKVLVINTPTETSTST